MKRILILVIWILSCATISAQSDTSNAPDNNPWIQKGPKGDDPQTQYTDKYIKDASKVALNWLNNINNNHYGSAYHLLTNQHKTRIKEKTWASLIDEFMKELGLFQSRVAINKYFTSEIEGKESGFYVFIEYKSAYERTKYFTDFLLLKQNDESEWEIDEWNYEWQFIKGTED